MSFNRLVNLGENSHYDNQLKGLPFSAHPRIEANGDIWNFGLHPSGDIVLYHLTANGRAKQVNIVKSNFSGVLHDFLITARHIILVLPSLKRDMTIAGLFNGIYFDPKLPMQALVIDKNTLTLSRTYELPPGMVFHFGNAWEDNQGDIHFDASLYQDFAVMTQLSDVMQGKTFEQYSDANTHLFTLHKQGKVSQHNFTDSSEFPRVCHHLIGQQNHLLFYTSNTTNSVWSDSVVARNLDTGKEDRFDYGADYLVEEHIPISPNHNEDQGYLIGTALHVPSKRTCLNIFSKHDISAGPIARAWLPYHLPLGFHGNFIAA
ncbi:carotenoid oxygenase family protein [Shewanella marina]|uniref:carotenoid oxygenase family protein n=1 Tax=Shewanella marina TaxID=487319 RepID=UPI00131F2077|nr:carotenoid oxygenase family protein [Shewanella marina]